MVWPRRCKRANLEVHPCAIAKSRDPGACYGSSLNCARPAELPSIIDGVAGTTYQQNQSKSPTVVQRERAPPEPESSFDDVSNGSAVGWAQLTARPLPHWAPGSASDPVPLIRPHSFHLRLCAFCRWDCWFVSRIQQRNLIESLLNRKRIG